MRRWIGVLASLVLIAACGSSAQSDVQGDAADLAATPETEPVQADLAVITAEGWGPLRIGMSREEVIASVGGSRDPDAVASLEPEYCDEFSPVDAPDGLYVMIEEGVLTRISIGDNTTLKTDAGLGIGDSADAVRAAYGEALGIEQHHYLEPPAEYLTVWVNAGPGDGPYADNPEARGIRYETDESRNVETIHAGGPSIQYIEGCL